VAFPKINKAILLLLSEEAAIWLPLVRPERLTESLVRDIAGVAHATYGTWKHGTAISEKLIDTIFTRIRLRIDKGHVEDEAKTFERFGTLSDENRSFALSMIDEFEAAFRKGAGAYKLAKILRIEMEECQKLMDTVIYNERPLFPALYYPANRFGRHDAETAFNPIKGLYRLWAKRGDITFRAPLRVRYVLPMRGGHGIRVKLNFPMLHPVEGEPPYYEYDGFVVARPDARKLFWMLEKRHTERNDYFQMITDSGKAHEGYQTFRGTYLTLGQDDDRSIVSSHVVMHLQERNHVEEMAGVMHDSQKIITRDDGEWQYAEKLLGLTPEGEVARAR
jgi:hypothetical protein